MSDWVLHQGDCVEVMRGLDASIAAAVIADPPYGIDYQSAWRSDKATWKPKIANDTQPFVWWLPQAYRATADGGCLLCFCRWDVQEAFKLAIGWAGYDVRSQVVWDRKAHGMGSLTDTFAPQHDILWFATKGDFVWPGRRPASVVRSMRLSGEALEHPNEKPLDLMRYLVRSLTSPGDTVLDPFCGKGTVGIACMAEERRYIGIDVDEGYCRMARQHLTLAENRQLVLLEEPA